MNNNIITLQWIFVTIGSLIFTGFLIYSMCIENELILFVGMITYLFFILFFFMITSNMGEKRFEKKENYQN